MRWIRWIGSLTLVLVVGPVIFAHSGGTDSQGCHTNRKTGDHHCHKPKSAPSREPSSDSSSSPSREPSPDSYSSPAREPVIISISSPARESAPKPYSGPERSFPPKDLLVALQTHPPPKPPGDGFEVVRPNPAQLIELAQTLLKGCKYDVSDRAGELGESTILAIRRFQTDRRQKAIGRVTPQLLLELAQAVPACTN